jgi:assimilatory nitrate reductase catalytic subunit
VSPAVRTVCPYCGVGCGILATVRGGRVTTVRGDPDHPTNRGGLCAKGQRLAETVRPGDRLLHPLRRPLDASGRFRREQAPERVSWDEALDACASRLSRVVAEHGPQAVAFYLSGQLLTEDYYVANKLVKGFLGTNNVDTNSRLCMASAAAAYRLAFGSDAPLGCYDDIDHATCVVFAGSNAAETHPILFGRLLAARSRTGARWVVIDPRRTPTAEAADLHLQLTPGSDLALLLALLRTCVEEGLVDRDFVHERTAGFEEAAAVAADWPPERAAAVCGVDAGQIRRAAHLIAGSTATLSLWCQGYNQSVTGTARGLGLINLHLATAQLGRRGAGPFSLTGQANAMGGREVGGMSTELAAHRRLADPGDREEVRAFWGSGPIDGRPGLTAVEMVDALLDGRLHAIWIAGSNPVGSLPDATRAEAALRAADLVVVQELYHPTDTSRFADVLLPAAGWAEKTGMLTSSERRVALAEALVAPCGEARPDWRIFADLGSRLGFPEAFAYGDAAEVFAEHAALTAGRTCDMAGISHDRVRAEGPLQWPCPAPGHAGTERRFLDGRFPTPDGRAHFLPTPHRPPAEEPTADRPLRLVTVRSRSSWHTMTKTGRVSQLRRDDGVPWVEVHPDDALAAGLRHGDHAELVTPRGSFRGVVRATDAVPAGTVAVPFHWTPLQNRGAWVNRITVAALDPHSRQPELKHAAVRLQRASASAPLDGLHLLGDASGGLRDRLAAALTAAGVRDLVVTGLDTIPLPGRPWLLVADGPASAAWLRGRGLSQPLLVDAGARIVDAEAAYAVGPGARLPGGLPLTGDVGRLAATLLVGGMAGPRALARAEWSGSGSTVQFSAGDPETAVDDDEQGVQRLVMADSARGVRVSWRLGAGQVLGVTAVGPATVLGRIADLWMEDATPDEVRAADYLS